ncbi:MAG: GAP family protein [Streptosporangiaceae bacterium]
MFGQAVGFALLAALSPTALVVAAAFLRSESPRRTVLAFLFGALLITVLAGVAAFLALRAGGLDHPPEREPRYGVRLGLGVLALAAGLLLARRKPRPSRPDARPGLVGRLVARPAPGTAFAVGLMVFAPSITYIAAVQALATADEATELVVLAAALVVTIVVMLAWLPLVLYLAAPDGTTRGLAAVNGWLRTRGHAVLVAGTAIAGLVLIANGAIGLAS